MSFIADIKPYTKAVVAFITPGLVALGYAVLEGSPGGTHITGAEIVGAVVACFATSTAVYMARNEPSPDPDPGGPAEAGDIPIGTAAELDDQLGERPDPELEPGAADDVLSSPAANIGNVSGGTVIRGNTTNPKG